MQQHKKNAGGSALVVSSNDLVHAKYNMTLWQKRLFAFAISQLNRDSQSFGWQRIYYADLLGFFEASGGKKAYEAIRQAPKELEMSIEVPYRDEQGNLRYAFLKLLSGYTVPGDEVERNQYVEVRFNEDLRPHLLELKERFMGYALSNLKRLRSTYSIRIFELLKSHEFRREVEFEIDYLRDILQVKDSYKLYGDFRRNILDKARMDLQEHCDISFDYEEIKRGNRVASILFFIKTNKAVRPDSVSLIRSAEKRAARMTAFAEKTAPKEAPKPTEKIVSRLDPAIEETIVKTWGISPASLEKLLEMHSSEAVEQAALLTKRRLQKSPLENTAGFFMAAVRDGFQDAEALKQAAKKGAAQKNERLAALKSELEVVRHEAWIRIYEVVFVLSEEQPTITLRALEALQSSGSPMVRGLVASAENGATLKDLRSNRPLMDLVIDEIIRQNPAEFNDVNAVYKKQENDLLDEIWRLSNR